MNLKFETIVQIFRKIIQLNAVIILKSTNEILSKKFLKKQPQNGPLSRYVAQKLLNKIIRVAKPPAPAPPTLTGNLLDLYYLF